MTARRWLGVIAGIQVALFVWLIAAGRIPRGHDGLQYLTIQYWFLDSAATGGGIPAWMPFMTHGTVANWWYPIQASPLVAFLLPIAPVIAGLSFLPLFHLAMLADHLVLLTGCWLLARRHMQTPAAAAFTALAASAVSAWVTQPWFGLHLFGSVALVLELLHRGWEMGRWRWILLAGNLFAVQTLGALPYLLPLSAFVVALYVASALATVPRDELRARAGALFCGRPLAIAAAVTAAVVPVASAYLLLKHGTGSIIDFAPGREADGSVPLRVFLTYGGRPDTGWDTNWLSILLSGTRTLDFDGYRGILLVPFAAFALLRGGARMRAWMFGGLVLLAVLNGTVLSAIAWAVFPGMSFYRHLGLAGGFVGLWLAFAGGFGVDLLLSRAHAGEGTRDAKVLGLLLAGVVLLLPLAVRSWLALAFTGSAPLVARADWDLLASSLWLGAALSAAVAALAGAVLLAGVRTGRWALAVTALVALHAVDAHGVRALEVARRTVPADAAQRAAFAFQPPRWISHRENLAPPNDRERAFASFFEKATREETRYGVVNWSMDTFLFRDSLGSAYRVDHWLEPFDDLVRTCAGEPLGGADAVRGMRAYAAYEFPLKACPAEAIAGVTHGKLQVFREAVRVGTTEGIAAAIRRPGFAGTALYVLDETAPAMTASTAGGALLAVSPVVEEFGANGLDVLLPASEGAWLYYADSWHPGWTATVNGRDTRVYRGNLAYKAIPLEPGRENHVRFRFRAPWVQAIYVFSAFEGAVWIGLVGWLLGSAWRRGDGGGLTTSASRSSTS